MAEAKSGHNGSGGQLADLPLILLPDGTTYSPKQIREKRDGSQGHTIVSGPGAQSSHAGAESLEFRVFPDGTLVDLVRDPAEPETPGLLISKDGRATIRRTFHYAGKEFVPRSLDPSLFSAIRLSSGVMPCAGARELIDELDECIANYVDIARDQQRLVAAAVIYTWFQDLLPVAPYLWVVGPPSSGKTTLLTLMQGLCRRALMVGDVTPASLYALPSAITPTLIIDEFETGRRARDRELLRLLRTGSTPSGRVVRGSKLYGTFCGKIIASRQMPDDTALASRAIFVSMLPTSRTLPPLDHATVEEIAARFQPKLLGYRLQNYHRVSTGRIPDVPDFSSRTKALARTLAAPLLGDETLEKELFDALAKQDREAKFDRYGEPEWAVALALFDECHWATGRITMGALTDTADWVLAENGETFRLKPRAVGNIVRSLGLETQQLGNLGRGLRLTREVVSEIHAIARRFGLKRGDLLPVETTDGGYGGAPCPLCEEYGLMVREDGTHLRCIELCKRPRGRTLYD